VQTRSGFLLISSTTPSHRYSLQLLELVGERYSAPTSSTVHVLGLSGTTSNAELLLSQAGLSAAVQQLFDFPASNSIKFPSPNAAAYVLKITPSTGVFSGSFTALGVTPAENRKAVPLAGVLLQGSQSGEHRTRRLRSTMVGK
jgi:hypothetical protein